MASGEHSCTRRAVLGAAVAVPLLPLDGGGRVGVRAEPGAAWGALRLTSEATPTLPSPIEGEGEWRRALAALRHAGVAMRRFERQTSGWPFEAQERGQADYDRLVDRYDAAMLRVVALPAPHLEALAFKTALIGDHRLWEVEGGEDCLMALEADARRLARLCRSGTLTPA